MDCNNVLSLAGLACTMLFLSSPPSTAQTSALELDKNVDLGRSVVQQIYVAADHKIYALQPSQHRIAIFSPEGSVISQIGMIGQEPGSFYYPLDFSVSGKEILVLEADDKRVQALTFAGRSLAQFSLPHQSNSITASPNGNICVADPFDSGLVSIYDIHGTRLRSFGEKLDFSEIYGSRHKSLDHEYKYGINRVLITTDASGNIYAAFIGVPLIREYASSGALLHEWKYPEQLYSQITRHIGDTLSISNSERFAEDGIPIPRIATGIVFDEERQLLLVTADWDGPHLLSLDVQTGHYEDQTLNDPHMHLSHVAITQGTHELVALMNKSGKETMRLYLKKYTSTSHQPERNTR